MLKRAALFERLFVVSMYYKRLFLKLLLIKYYQHWFLGYRVVLG